MRIAVITNAYPPEAQGGAGVITAELVALWQASGHEVRVWVRRAEWLKRGLLFRLFGHLFLDRRPSPDCPEIIAWQPDLVVTHNLTGVGWGTGRWFRSAGVPWVHVLHDVQLFEPSGQARADRVTWWQRGWSAWRQMAFGEPTRVVSPTAWLLKAHERRGFKFARAVVLPNPAPESFIPSRTRLDAPWLFIGRLSEDKGADFLLQIIRSHPNESFLCIGEGPLRPAVEVLPNARCLGMLPRVDVQAVLRLARALLMPSRLQENQPTVILEAFSAAVPVIASSLGGVPETVGNGGLVLPLETAAWSRAMSEMSAHRGAWSQRAAERARSFAPQRVGERWERLFSEVTSLSAAVFPR